MKHVAEYLPRPISGKLTPLMIAALQRDLFGRPANAPGAASPASEGRESRAAAAGARSAPDGNHGGNLKTAEKGENVK